MSHIYLATIFSTFNSFISSFGFNPKTLFLGLLILYIISAVILIIMDERPPATAMAWILFVILVPGLGIIVYLFAGRNLRVIGTRAKVERDAMRTYLEDRLKPYLDRQSELQTDLENSLATPSHRRLVRNAAYSNTSLLTVNNEVELLRDGAKKFPKLKADIKNAKRYVHLGYFIWADDDMMVDFQNLLIQKAEEGVEVRVAYDALGSTGLMPKAYKQKFIDSKVEFYPTLPLNSLSNILGAQYRNHTKVAIIDGEIGYNGGMNMAEEYLTGGKHYKSWRDEAMRVRGDNIVALQAIFAQTWYITRGEMLDASYFKPVIPKSNPKVPIQLVFSSPYSETEAIKNMYLEMINSAQKQVWIQSPYFIPDEAMLAALRNAAMAGVDVRFMITGVPDKKSVLAAGSSYFHSIMQAGVRVFYYEPGFLHIKAISIDSEIVTVGSANFDIRSFRLDFEATNLTYDAAMAKQFEADFEDDMTKCREFTVEAWNALPWRTRFYYALCRLTSPLL
jgi:cardiolipin synthase